MATATATPTIDEIQKMTVEDQLKHFGPPPDGQSYVKINGKLVIDGATGRAITKKKKGGGKRNKPKKPLYTVPAGKLRSSDTPGFDTESHARLKVSDFNDPLDFARWEVWYFERKVERAKTNVENIQASGATPEERKNFQDKNRLLTAMENLVRKEKATGGKISTALQERLGKLFAAVSEG